MGVGKIDVAVTIVDGVEGEDDGAIEFGGVVDRLDEEVFDFPLGLGVAALEAEMPAHDGEGETGKEGGRHGAVRLGERGDVDMAIKDHG